MCWQLGKRQRGTQNELADDQGLLVQVPVQVQLQVQVQVQLQVQVQVRVQVLRHQFVAHQSIELEREKYWILRQ